MLEYTAEAAQRAASLCLGQLLRNHYANFIEL